MLAATVVIPTHDHGPLLIHALASARRQSVRELEIIVIGDGAPDVTREIMAEAVAADPRIRYVDRRKGTRQGEVYRHEILKDQAQGEIVCYLCDDDLWFPDHVAQMRILLREADFACSAHGRVRADGSIYADPIDPALPYFKWSLQRRGNRIPLSFGGHRLDFYRRLPHGWRTTPVGTFTDYYMWLQILAMPGCRSVAGMSPTGLHLPSPFRDQMSAAERLAEIARWRALIENDDDLAQLKACVSAANLQAALLETNTFGRSGIIRAWWFLRSGRVRDVAWRKIKSALGAVRSIGRRREQTPRSAGKSAEDGKA